MTDRILCDIFLALSDQDTLKMFQTIVLNQKKIEWRDFDTRKKYYSRLTKLKKNFLVKKEKKNSVYVVTAFGSIIYDAFLHARKTQDLYWQLRIIDTFNETVPEDQRKKMIESLMPHDDEIRKILLPTRH
jgi:hypothetical protein